MSSKNQLSREEKNHIYSLKPRLSYCGLLCLTRELAKASSAKNFFQRVGIHLTQEVNNNSNIRDLPYRDGRKQFNLENFSKQPLKIKISQSTEHLTDLVTPPPKKNTKDF